VIVTRKMAEQAWELMSSYCKAPEGPRPADEVWSFPLTAEAVAVAFKQAAKVAHPDAGGSMEAFVAVDRAKHVLLAWLAKPQSGPAPAHGEPCPRCTGKGFILSQRAFRAMRLSCPMCRGTGELNVEQEKEY
jgi:hypothetical protein